MSLLLHVQNMSEAALIEQQARMHFPVCDRLQPPRNENSVLSLHGSFCWEHPSLLFTSQVTLVSKFRRCLVTWVPWVIISFQTVLL